ncbi:heparinase II/III family protein [Candidatus Poribacteria bacterium]
MSNHLITLVFVVLPIICWLGVVSLCAAEPEKHVVPQEHPRLLGSRDYLENLARERAESYKRVVWVAREQKADDHAKMVSMALVCAIEQDEQLGKAAVEMAMKYINGPIRKGHVTFAHDLARCAIVYDLCYEYWTLEQRVQFHEYMNKTVDANVRSESHVFHNGWYGYKNWGIGLSCYATYYENDRAPEILKTLRQEWLARAAPALDAAGDGGGWAEGYYINYWLYEWLFLCEVARRCEGVDYYEDAPKFFKNRAVASMFEAYPGIRQYNSRRPIPMGDGGGRGFGGDRDKVLSARRILVNYFRDDPDHQVVHAFNEITPRSGVGVNAYKDFLWRDITVEKGDLEDFKLSHISPGPGYVYARSSWDDDAIHFFFKCGDRYTAHQHLDVGHFLIYKNEELASDGGHYESFGSEHDVNYHLRTIAHSTMLIHDPSEVWTRIRAGNISGNDGGQAHDWPHHNGAVTDLDQWKEGRELYDIADILAFEDKGSYLYVAGDCTRAYSPKKIDYFTRQIVFIRPGTFVIFDRVKSRNPDFKKTWLLQAMKPPARTESHLVVTNGQGRLFVQTLLPSDPKVRLVTGTDLYSYGGKDYSPRRDTGPAPECRIEISPSEPASEDYFLHVLTATDADTASVEQATVQTEGQDIVVTVGETKVRLGKDVLTMSCDKQ